MARILIATHAYDRFEARSFLLTHLFDPWRAAGHEIVVHAGVRDVPTADVAIVHVDRTTVSDDYLEALRHIPIVVNGRARDLSKRVVSRRLVGAFDPYPGPVIVKTDANAGGVPEWHHATEARRRGEPVLPSGRVLTGGYPIFDKLADVPLDLRLDPDLVVEQLTLERDPRGFAMRHWIFFGDRERCSRVVSPHRIVKGRDLIDRTLVEVPERLREERARLGLDYGKLDFVMHDGEAILLDANRTPTSPQNLSAMLRAGAEDLARGLDVFLK
ncbi:MAG: hypothetical protein ACHREM_05515 [Polyangiales bacterium]